MTSQEISRIADRLFQSLVPETLAIRNQQDQEDYGIDYELELMKPGDQPSGFIFKIQQKGTRKPLVIHGGETLSFSDLTVSKARYYLSEIEIPAVFVLVDVSARICYWTFLQGNDQLRQAYQDAIAENRKTVTLHIPTTNRLPESWDRLIASVADMQDVLIVNAVRTVSPQRILTAVRRLGALEEVAQAVRTHHDMLRCEQIERLLAGGHTAEAFRKSSEYFRSETESLAMRFTGGLNVMRIATVTHASDDPKGCLKLELDVSYQLLRLVRSSCAPSHLRAYAHYRVRAARLHVMARRYGGLFLSSLIQPEEGAPFAKVLVQSSCRRAMREVLVELAKTQSRIGRLVEKGHFWLLPDVWVQLATYIQPLVGALRRDTVGPVLERITNWMDTIGRLAVEIATSLEQWRSLALCAVELAMLADPGAPDAYRRVCSEAREYIRSITDDRERSSGLALLEHAISVAATEPKLSIDDEVRMYKEMAVSMGVDLDDPEDDIGRIVRIGLMDLNPERVLKNCQHLFVSIGPHGLPARMLQLPTAGGKWLHCTRHGHRHMGLSLDDLHASFAEDHCTDCPDSLPREDEWQWNREWQQEQDKKHRALADRANKVLGGPPPS